MHRIRNVIGLNRLWLIGAIALFLSACGESGRTPGSSATPEPSKVAAEAPFTLACSGQSGNENEEKLPGEFSFRVTVDGQQKSYWIHDTEWKWSYWKPLIAADNEVRELLRLNAEIIELGVFGVQIHRTTGKIGDGGQMHGTCHLVPLSPIPIKKF